jgi:hypothetical protein
MIQWGGKFLYSIVIEYGVPMKLVSMMKMCFIETFDKVCIGEHLSEKSMNQNGLKQIDTLGYPWR